MEKIPTRILRKMRYKADSQGIIDRYINVNGAWEGHLQHTKNFILKAGNGNLIPWGGISLAVEPCFRLWRLNFNYLCESRVEKTNCR